MATIAKRAIDVAKTISGNPARMLSFPEAASQTFKKGAVLTFNASGYVIVSASDNPTRILGVAAEDAHNATSDGDKKIMFYVADDDTVFLANLSDSAVTALTDRGRDCGIKNESGTWTVDKTATKANSRLIICDLHADYDTVEAVGDTNGRVHFQFFSQYRILNHTS